MSKRTSINDREEKAISNAVGAFITNTESKNEEKLNTEIVSNNESEKVNIKITSLTVDARKARRIAYELKEDTISNVEKAAKKVKMKKYELVEMILSSVCKDILKQ